ncbi:hypothetical protein niasHS_010424 [Heterodera schachtii]|uniref:DUF7087 domain-containing protein n=2 Tax=Heterodera TaxID=34509 RepID=A0ABD2J4G3_HETSC
MEQLDSTLNAAKNETERLADQLKKSAEQAQKEVRERTLHQDPYLRLVYQLQTAHLVALGIEVLTLYLGWRDVNFVWLLLPLLFCAGAIWIVSQRWYHQTDGRSDFNKVLSADKMPVRAKAASCLVGGFVLSLLAQWTAPTMGSTAIGLLFSLSSHAAVLVGAVCSAIELYEGVKLKNR